MKVYKIVRKEKDKLKWLFHGNFGTRTITQYRWTKAQVRPEAIDGKGIPYRSGFHCTKNLEDLIDYAKRFKNRKGLRIVECELKDNIRFKKKSKTVLLGENILVGETVYNLELNKPTEFGKKVGVI